MKLSQLYTNQLSLFAPIRFHDGLNVIVADVRHPSDRKKVSHNLGKTLLIELLDFGLLKGLDDRSVLKRQAEIFNDFVFFLEIRLQSGGYVTVRRSVKEASKVSFKRHRAAHLDLVELPEKQWDHWRVPFDSAVSLLDGILALSAIKPWSYRKGVAYFLRSQGDYGDVFRLSKFQRSKDSDWKPYVARVLGYDDEVLSRKYEIEGRVADLKRSLASLRSEVPYKSTEFEKLKAAIAVKRDEVDSGTLALDAFDFSPRELALARELTEVIESEIARVNESLYNARYDLTLVERGLREAIDFDLDAVKRVFTEVQLAFPDQLARDYSDLLNFNQKILTERHEHLRLRGEELQAYVATLEAENARLASRRRQALSALSGTDSLKKFKDLQRSLDADRASLTGLEASIKKLGEVMERESEIRALGKEADALSELIQHMAARGSARFTAIQVATSRIVKEILGRSALVFASPNKEGNLDFNAQFTDADDDSVTEEGRGTSFRQVLCLAFDLAVLASYGNEAFFHFVYHDGALERLETKRKLALLEVVRRLCEEHNIQYIFSALAEDIPTGAGAEKLTPKPDEIVVRLHDDGPSGRLFKMNTF